MVICEIEMNGLRGSTSEEEGGQAVRVPREMERWETEKRAEMEGVVREWVI